MIKLKSYTEKRCFPFEIVDFPLPFLAKWKRENKS